MSIERECIRSLLPSLLSFARIREESGKLQTVPLSRSLSGSSTILPRRLLSSIHVPLPLPLPVHYIDGELRLPSPKEKEKEKDIDVNLRETDKERMRTLMDMDYLL